MLGWIRPGESRWRAASGDPAIQGRIFDSAEQPIRKANCNNLQVIKTQRAIWDRAVRGVRASIPNFEFATF